MLNCVSISVFQRDDAKKKDGTIPVCLRVIMGRSKKVFSLNISARAEHWDAAKMRLRPGAADFVTNNISIQAAIDKARTMIARADLDGRLLSLEDFSREFSRSSVAGMTFLEFWADDLERFKNRYSPETRRTNKSQMTKLKAFRSVIRFDELTPYFWKKYESYLTKLGNNDNTIHKAFRTVKAYINKAIVAGIILDNPLKGIKVKKLDGSREYLTIDQVNTLDALFHGDTLSKAESAVLRYFLFSCYTGLRYTDVRILRHKDIAQDGAIKIHIHKTRQYLVIPLHDKARALIPDGIPDSLVFRTYTNQATNRYLKDIMSMEKVDIQKKISFHCARHTFATICLSDLAIPLSTVQRLLGHTEIRHTQIYARVLDSEKERSMNKWNSL